MPSRRIASWCLVLPWLVLDSVRGFAPSSTVPFVGGRRSRFLEGRRTQHHVLQETTTEVVAATADFTIETEELPTGKFHRLTFPSLPGQDASVPPIVMETGKIGRLAAGAVKVARGDTVLYSTASRDADPKEGIDFLPLSVEHQERFSSAGMTSGSYNKRDGRPAEHEILVCRLIDRPLRPLIDPGWRHETQLLSWVLSYDGERSCDSLAIVAAATATAISDIPLLKPVAAVQVGLVDGVFLVNPTEVQMDESKLLLTVAGTADAVLMIEGEADFLPEATFLEAVVIGHKAIRVLCAGIQALSDAVGIAKKYDTIVPPPMGLQDRVNELFTDRVDAMYAAPGNKRAKGLLMNEVQTAATVELIVEFPGQEKAIEKAFKNLLCNRMFECVKATGQRGDGRAVDEIRTLTMETSLLPRVHGSALFTRGETQAIATATLGDSGMRQKIDKISGAEQKRFYLQYTFPPSCVGETGRVGAPGRREVGHGNLAERALAPTLPSELDFPYTIRVESLITESHGSSSMASVCGGCLALMDAGVPIKKPIAGIAMGMLLDESSKVSGDSAIVLSDITGTEDALGTMDFKVAGDREGITTFQMDIKCEGLSLDTMARALEQARIGRLHILDEMEKVMSTPRSVLPPSVPKIVSFTVPVESIGKLIGPGGRQIRTIIEDFALMNMDIADSGSVQISAFDQENLTKAESFVKSLVSGAAAPSRGGASGGGGPEGGRVRPGAYSGPEPVIGEVYEGKITGVQNFGIFVEILSGPEDGSTRGFEALCHISELAIERVATCEAFVSSLGTDTLKVKYLGKDDRGKTKVSRKAVLQAGQPVPPRRPPLMDRTNNKANGENVPPPAQMSDAELDVIAKAIEGL